MNSSSHVATAPGTGRTRAVELASCADRLLEVVPRTMRHIRQAMRARAARGLTVPQLRALLYVRRNPGAGLSAVAEHLGMSPPAGSALVERLVRAGQLERATDPAERRRIQLRLTRTGALHVTSAHEAAREWLTRELGDLDGRDLARLDAALDVLDRIGSKQMEPSR
jgi:DNA-binding MarR family transcriptional regulator